MEKYYISLSLRNLITKLLADGLSPHYQEVLNFIDKNPNNKEIQYLFYTLEHLKQNTILLDLKIQEYKLHQINEFLQVPTNLLPQSDGFIHINASASAKIQDYYEIPPDAVHLIKIDNFVPPEKGQTKIFYETTYDNRNGYRIPVIREMEVNHENKVLRISLSKKNAAPFRPKLANPEEIPSIYKGILGDILENLLEDKKTEC